MDDPTETEPWDFADIDRTIQGGVSLNGKQWGRPDDTIGIAGIVNNISGVHLILLTLSRPFAVQLLLTRAS